MLLATSRQGHEHRLLPIFDSALPRLRGALENAQSEPGLSLASHVANEPPGHPNKEASQAAPTVPNSPCFCRWALLAQALNPYMVGDCITVQLSRVSFAEVVGLISYTFNNG